jgi:hypothetical protein
MPQPPMPQQPGGAQYGHGPGFPGVGQQQGYGWPPPAPRKKKSPLPWVVGGAGGLVVVSAVLVLGFVSPGWFYRTVFNADSVEKGVRQILVHSYKIEGIESVDCPEGESAEPRHSFDCRLRVSGAQHVVTVTVKDVQGTYEVGRPR